LGLACFFARTPVAAYLLGEGADPNLASRNAFRVAPLHSAAAARATDIVRLLLEHRADVHASQQGNQTALHSAAHHGEVEMTRMLLRYGANPQSRTDQGQTPYDMAIEKGFTELAAWLKVGGEATPGPVAP
jgi:ankyrin repeat protein